MPSNNIDCANGSGQPATVNQIVAVGAVDAFLHGDPVRTCWRKSTQQTTNFATETVEISSTSGRQCRLGGTMDYPLGTVADLAYELYVKVTLPAIKAESRTDAAANGSGAGWGEFPIYQESAVIDGKLQRVYRNATHRGKAKAFWINAVGFALVDRCSYQCGTVTIDSVSSHYLYMWEELSGKPGKRLGEMIGKYGSIDECIEASSLDRQLYIPVPFTWSGGFGKSTNLPMVALQFHVVKVCLATPDISKLIAVALPCDIAPREDTTADEYRAQDDPWAREHYRVIAASDLTVVTRSFALDLKIDVGYVYLDQEERTLIVESDFQDLQMHVQSQDFDIPAGTHRARVPLDFNHPVTELIWCAQREEAPEHGDYFNYAARDDREDPIEFAALSLNNSTRFKRESEYFRMQRPHSTHTSMPNGYIYSYSFANDSETLEPDGSLNFSRIDNTNFTINLQKRNAYTPFPDDTPGMANQESWRVRVYARFYNLFNKSQGMGGLLYSN